MVSRFARYRDVGPVRSGVVVTCCRFSSWIGTGAGKNLLIIFLFVGH